MNTKLLRQIQERILKSPHHFNMRDWFMPAVDDKNKECGTAGCIAGWAITIDAGSRLPKAENLEAWSHGDVMRLLELDEVEAKNLFYLDHWPKQFRMDYVGAKTHFDRAKATVARIDHFIATEGRE